MKPLERRVRAYHAWLGEGPHPRARSWEFCYSYFRRIGPSGIASQQEIAALQLGFYLASWGMYRGSTFLLQHDYTIHFRVLECLAKPEFAPLWKIDFGADQSHSELIPIVLDATRAISAAYAPRQPTDTLITKIMLGTIGTLPALDDYFKKGFKARGSKYSYLNKKFVERVFTFCREQIDALTAEQRRIHANSGVHYPLMKLIDMYFFHVGFEPD